MVDRRHVPVGPRARDRVRVRDVQRRRRSRADGLLLFLADGAAPQGVGAFGAALGYSCRHEQSQGAELPCDLPGVPAASQGSRSTSTATSPCR
ncbi:hypothetical protein P9139_05680 [Curtobacterium flaccumfaciens]|nr:hypothetical protein P9139_05680 [Curtobacterium flaccumfaciens]